MTETCDVRNCGAHAYLKAELNGSDLYFCAHHATERIDALMVGGFSIADHRDDAECRCRQCAGPEPEPPEPEPRPKVAKRG